MRRSVIDQREIGAEHHDLMIFEPIKHPELLNYELEGARIALPAHDATELGRAAERARDLREILDVFESFHGELDRSMHHCLDQTRRLAGDQAVCAEGKDNRPDVFHAISTDVSTVTVVHGARCALMR